MQEFAVTLFDPDGMLKPEHYKATSSAKGSGAFGAEINHRTEFGIIDMMEVLGPGHLRKGLGSAALGGVYSQPVFDGVDFFFATMGPAEVPFFRANGYRRIGQTGWFAYALDPRHPSRSIAVADDYDPPDFGRPRETRTDVELAAAFPVHSAIVRHDPRGPSPVTLLYAMYPQAFETPDDQGVTPLQLALSGSRYDLALQILTLPEAHRYAVARDPKGRTMLQTLRASLEDDRAFRITFGLPAQPPSPAMEGCIARLTTLLGPDAAEDATMCTCGRCIGDLFSPFMREELAGALALVRLAHG
jgi:hypothetical protein